MSWADKVGKSQKANEKPASPLDTTTAPVKQQPNKKKTNTPSRFQTDSKVTGRRRNKTRKNRALNPFYGKDSSGSGDTFEQLDNEDGGWDQFKANKKLFGVESTFDMGIYTSELDTNSDFYKKNVAAAERKAREIQGKTSKNVHVMEDRGVINENINEEDMYSTVVRDEEGPEDDLESDKQGDNTSDNQDDVLDTPNQGGGDVDQTVPINDDIPSNPSNNSQPEPVEEAPTQEVTVASLANDISEIKLSDESGEQTSSTSQAVTDHTAEEKEEDKSSFKLNPNAIEFKPALPYQPSSSSQPPQPAAPQNPAATSPMQVPQQQQQQQQQQGGTFGVDQRTGMVPGGFMVDPNTGMMYPANGARGYYQPDPFMVLPQQGFDPGMQYPGQPTQYNPTPQNQSGQFVPGDGSNMMLAPYGTGFNPAAGGAYPQGGGGGGGGGGQYNLYSQQLQNQNFGAHYSHQSNYRDPENGQDMSTAVTQPQPEVEVFHTPNQVEDN